jgi:hypothetical protein
MPDLECKAKKRKGLARKGEIYTEELTYRRGFPHLASILGGSRAIEFTICDYPAK